jgi:CRISPR/Cas system-associated exonuclease Cas4 (RecB family)
MYLSATAIKDWLECPQRLGYRLQGIKQEPTVWMARGTAVHETIENQSITTVEDAKQFFFIRFAELLAEENPKFPYRVTFANLVAESNQMLDYYYNWVNIHEPPIREIELQFKIRIRDIEYSGKIDQIRGNNVYDWKTRTSKVPDVVLKSDYQFTLYGMVYKELYGDYPENLYYGNLYAGQLIKMERTRKDYKYLEDVSGKIIFAAENEIFPRNYGEYTCKNCAYRYKCFNDQGEVTY